MTSVDLLVPELREHDATGTHTLLLRDLLVAQGAGPVRIVTQVPTTDMVASVRVERSECSVMDNSVRYHHHNIVTDTPPVSPTDNEGVRRRTKEQENSKVTPSKSKDPLKWFGILSPPSLKRSQVRGKQ